MDRGESSHPQVAVHRHHDRFEASARRVILRYFPAAPGSRLSRLLTDFLRLDPAERHSEWALTLARFQHRHRDVRLVFRQHLSRLSSELAAAGQTELLAQVTTLPDDEQLLLGAVFSMEYSYAAAAWFNPSMVPHPDQSGVAEGACRFILSFRAVGEGHISSLVFRSGVVGVDGQISLDPVSPYSAMPTVLPEACYHRETFLRKLKELGLGRPLAEALLAGLGASFTRGELDQALAQLDDDTRRHASEALKLIRHLADSNYAVAFASSSELSERIIFPVSAREQNGIEDARFVRFIDDNHQPRYLATYSAYDGEHVLPQLLETDDFLTFHMRSLNGAAVRNKGLALFPRRIGGDYLMLGRQDGETITLMRSDQPHFWHRASPLLRPRHGWELVQLGNCGSPLETEAGWLVLTHGVGPMRRYCLGAALLDSSDPTRVIGRLREPLLQPTDLEREGYVPNVLYSCGGMIHQGRLILPYAMSDAASGLVTIDLVSLLDRLVAVGPD